MNKFFSAKIITFFIISIFAYFVFTPALFSNDLPADSLASQEQQELSHEDLIRGERLFHGLVYFGDQSVNCAACHNTSFVDTLNWNPNAHEIAIKYRDKSLKDLSNVLLKPRSPKLMESHKNFELSDADVSMIKGFMDEFAEKGLKPQKTIINHLLIFIFVSLLILYSLVDIILLKKLNQKWIHLVILLGGGIYITNTLVKEGIAVGRSPGYSPDQPIKFSHKVHAGQNGTDCLYCHSSAESSKTAGIPPSGVCMNCHLIVRNGTRSGAFEIAKVIKAYESGEAINWVKIYNLPDHVYFNHSQHVSVAGISCQECHGQVQEMDRVIQNSDLSMGWCINCHREKEVSFHDNGFYQVYRDKVERMNSGEIDSVTVEMVGGTECMKCHY